MQPLSLGSFQKYLQPQNASVVLFIILKENKERDPLALCHGEATPLPYLHCPKSLCGVHRVVMLPFIIQEMRTGQYPIGTCSDGDLGEDFISFLPPKLLCDDVALKLWPSSMLLACSHNSFPTEHAQKNKSRERGQGAHAEPCMPVSQSKAGSAN